MYPPRRSLHAVSNWIRWTAVAAKGESVTGGGERHGSIGASPCYCSRSWQSFSSLRGCSLHQNFGSYRQAHEGENLCWYYTFFFTFIHCDLLNIYTGFFGGYMLWLVNYLHGLFWRIRKRSSLYEPHNEEKIQWTIYFLWSYGNFFYISLNGILMF